MNINVTFEENAQSFAPNFGEVYEVNDGGYEQGYADGYEVGNTDGYTKGHEEGVKDGIASLPVYDGEVIEE